MITADYDAIAEWYDQNVRSGALLSGDEVINSDLFDAIGSIEGMTVCDLACGQGKMARQLAERGAKVVGIDVSQKLLDIARREEEVQPRGIGYTQDDAQLLAYLSDATFDGVLCNMALMDIPDVRSTFGAVRRILKSQGWFAFTITHPCFEMPPAKSYYAEGFWRSDNPHGVRGKVGAHHRTLSTYLNALTEAGMTVQHTSEPRRPGRDMPAVLTIFCRKVMERGTR